MANDDDDDDDDNDERKSLPRSPFPDQPIVLDEHGVPRFQANRIVRTLLDFAQQHEFGLNEIAIRAIHGEFSPAEEQQLAQLIGYSVSGYGDLSYVNEEDLARADKAADEMCHKSKRHVV